MRIPDGSQFGQVVARPGPMVNINPDAYGAGIARAVTQAGQIGMEIANDYQERKNREEEINAIALEREQRKAQEARDKVQHVAKIGSVRNSLKDLGDDVQRRMTAGEVAPGEVGKLYDERADELLQANLKGVAPEMADLIAAEAIGPRGENRNRVIDASVTHTRQLIKTDILAAGEQFERSATSNRGGAIKSYEQLLDVMGPQAGLAPDAIQKDKQNFRERTAFNAADAMIRSNLNDQNSLDALQARINTDEFADLTPERRGQLEQKILGRKQYLVNLEQVRISRNEAAAARRERHGEKMLNQVRDFLDSGGSLDQNFMEQASKAVSGTSSAPLLTTMLRQSSEGSAFAQMAPQQQREELIRLRGQASANGSSPAQEKRLEHFERIANATEKQLQTDPLVFGQRRNLIALQPLNFNGVDDLLPQLAVRTEQAAIVSARIKQPVSPLMADEAEKLSGLLSTLPVPAQKTAVRNLAKVLDPAMGQALAKQMSAKDNTLGLAFFASVNATGAPRDAAELILKGADAVKSGRLKSSADDSTASRDHATIARNLAEVPWATTQARDAAVRAAQLAYDGLRDERNPSVSKAIAYTSGNLVEWAGSKVPIPHDWDERQFKRALERFDVKKLERQAGGNTVFIGGQPLPVDKLAGTLKDVNLIPVGVGSYALQSGGQMVLTGKGLPMRITVKD